MIRAEALAEAGIGADTLALEAAHLAMGQLMELEDSMGSKPLEDRFKYVAQAIKVVEALTVRQTRVTHVHESHQHQASESPA